MRQAITLCTVLAALSLAAPAATAKGSMDQNTGKFWLKGPGPAQNCKYDTIAACQKDKKTGQQCAANANTTGLGTPSGTLNDNTMKK